MTLFLVRHAQAGSRAESNLPDDTLRPLTREGRHQAAALAGLLDDMGATSVYTSPYRRCVQTAVPLGAHLAVPVIETDDLGEGPADDAIQLVRKLANDSAALFSHGDIIPAVLEHLVANDSIDLGPSPRCQKGSIWMLETNGFSDTFVKATYVPAWRFNVGPAD
jgi:broad specificity phosphatase PhoE